MAPRLDDGGMGYLRTGDCNFQAIGKSFLDVSKESKMLDLYLGVYLRGTTQTSDPDLTFRQIWQSSPVLATSTSLRWQQAFIWLVSSQPRDRECCRKMLYWEDLGD